MIILVTQPPATAAVATPIGTLQRKSRACIADGRAALARFGGEYLVNIVKGRRTAQERVTGGRWRRIVLGDVLAEHILELRGRARVWPWR